MFNYYQYLSSYGNRRWRGELYFWFNNKYAIS